MMSVTEITARISAPCHLRRDLFCSQGDDSIKGRAVIGFQRFPVLDGFVKIAALRRVQTPFT